MSKNYSGEDFKGLLKYCICKIQNIRVHDIAKANFDKLRKNRYEKKHYIITRCPNCSQKLRLPRNKGNILVTCARCSFKFKLKT